MKDLKLLVVGSLFFLVLPLLATTTLPKRKEVKCKEVPPNGAVVFLDYKDIQKKKVTVEACYSINRWCVYGSWGCFEIEVPQRCTGSGYGGGGGSIF